MFLRRSPAAGVSACDGHVAALLRRSLESELRLLQSTTVDAETLRRYFLKVRRGPATVCSTLLAATQLAIWLTHVAIDGKLPKT